MSALNALGLGGLVDAVGKVADDLFTSDKERMDAEIEVRKLGLEEKRIDQATDLAQIEVNKEEAKSEHWFVAGWRPAAGWVGVAGMAYAGIVEPMAQFIAKVLFGYSGVFPEVNTEVSLQVLLGLLGLGALRSWDKKSARKASEKV